ncbi:MAG: hypothetical protein RIF33_13245 [Cyclobacteriaceae bacterium]
MDEPKRNLEFENELKKLKLQSERGASFMEGENELSAEAESAWLDHITAFEEAADKKITAKVRDVLGEPSITPLHQLNDEQLIVALDIILEQMKSHGIELSVLYDVSDREVYRFIVEELFEHEMNVIDVPGLVTHFTYEEFHPNDTEDIKQSTIEFIDMLMKRSFEFIDHQLAKKLRYDNRKMSEKEFVKLISGKMTECSLELLRIDQCEVTINEDKAVATATTMLTDTNSQMISTTAVLSFISQYGYWYINEIELPWLD